MNVNPVAFRTIRELAGFSQAELSRRTGISQGHISQIESGQKRPRPQTLRTFARVMGVPLGSLLCADQDAEPAAEVSRDTARSNPPL